MEKTPALTLKVATNTHTYKTVGIAFFTGAFFLLALAAYLYFVTKGIEPLTFNIMAGLAALLLVESFFLPRMLRKATQGTSVSFYNDHLDYYLTEKRSFSLPYEYVTGVRTERINNPKDYNDSMAENLYLSIRKDVPASFPPLLIKNGELIIPGVPREQDAVRRISALTASADTEK